MSTPTRAIASSPPGIVLGLELVIGPIAPDPIAPDPSAKINAAAAISNASKTTLVTPVTRGICCCWVWATRP